MILVGAEGDEQIDHYAGLGQRSPLLAVGLLVSMLSLAGIPFTVGFLGKFFIFDAAIRQHQTLLVVIGVITVGCGFYYYLKVVRAMFWLEPPHDAAATAGERAFPRRDCAAHRGHFRPRRLSPADPERAPAESRGGRDSLGEQDA